MSDTPVNDNHPPTVAENAWGRVDATGAVFVRTSDGERLVGSWQADAPEEALAFYGRRYDDLVVQADLLEQRLRAGSAALDEAATSVKRLREAIHEPQGVGDLQGLSQRLDGLEKMIEEQRAARRAARAQALAEAKERKEAIAREAEAIAEGTDWRGGADRLRALLDEWKGLPRIERSVDDVLWRRFSTARTHYTRRRKAHFAELGERREHARAVKESIVAEAEQLADSTDWGPTSSRFRELMAQWKAAGPAPKPVDEALWRRFRAAQDRFFTARSEARSERDNQLRQNLERKLALLEEAERLIPVTDWKAARESLRSVHERWETVGPVPRSEVRTIESRLRRVEEAVRTAESQEWRRTNPEARARAEATVAQLRASIAELEERVAAARASGDTAAVSDAEDSLSARRAWLVEAEKALAEFSG